MLSEKMLRPVFPFFADIKALKVCLGPDASWDGRTTLHPTQGMAGTQLVLRRSQKCLGHAMVYSSGLLAGRWTVLPTSEMQCCSAATWHNRRCSNSKMVCYSVGTDICQLVCQELHDLKLYLCHWVSNSPPWDPGLIVLGGAESHSLTLTAYVVPG